MKLFKSFKYAFQGIAHSFKNERNMKVHILLLWVSIVLGVLLHCSLGEWCILILCFGLVIGFEMMNTALENFCDLIEPKHHKSIGVVKDVAAGAVLVVSMSAFIIGLIIFLPKLFSLL